jgi:hypothetical protein
MANHTRRKGSSGSTAQPVAKEVVACLAAHTGLPQADFRTKRKIKRFAAGGKRRGALIRALLARPALQQLGLRQQDFDKAELSGKSTVGDIITVVAKAAKPPKEKAATKRTPATTGTTRRSAKASKAAKPAKTKNVARTSKAPKHPVKKTPPRRTKAAQKATAAARAPIGKRATKATTASKPRLEEDAGATTFGEAPRAGAAQRAPRAPKASRAEAPDPSCVVPGSEEMAIEANVQPDSSAGEPQASRVADVLLRDALRDEQHGPQPG